jgi:fructose-1,6-bisphosphatase I
MSISTDPVTLTRFLIEECKEESGLVTLMVSIQLACKTIALAVRKAGIAGLYGLEGSVNVSGDSVKKLDILSNDVFKNAVKYSRHLCVLVSEEEDKPIVIEDSLSGKYCVCTDPLDGSSNIDCNVSTGTIFGIYSKTMTPIKGKGDVLRPGRELLAAGYCMYGSSTQLVLTTGNGVNGFTLDPAIGEFILTHKKLTIPEKSKTIYSINEGNSRYWDHATSSFVSKVKNLTKPYSLRYVGSMVSDVHRTLLYGGIFMYPADSKSKAGKLRLLYEANPMAYICEQAGGYAVANGGKRILDIQPTNIHCRTGIFLGCKRDVGEIMRLYKESSEKEKEPDVKKVRTS